VSNPHHHDHGAAVGIGATARRRIVAVVVAIAAIAVVGLVVLWPRGSTPSIDAQGLVEVDATVASVERGRCASIEVPGADTDCQIVFADVTSGPTRGDTAYLELRDIDFSIPSLSVGDKVVLRYAEDAPAPFNYSFWDMQRAPSLWLLLGVFVFAVVLVGRARGLRALVGLVASLAIVVWFVLPSLLQDNNALAVALCGTTAIALVVLYLAHGVNMATSIALLGTLASLALIALLAVVFVEMAQLTGLSDESAQVLRVTADAVDPRGILIAGTVIGALGVLDDITVTQVAVVAELRDVDRSLSARELYRRALRVGRDHIASTVNTLILAYVGASLPLLLFFTQSGQSIGRVSTREIVAEEIVRALVGSIGLVAAVPLTTALAAYLLHGDVAAAEPDAAPQAEGTPTRASSPAWEDFAPEP
jgi:uncharacterized membrane protein